MRTSRWKTIVHRSSALALLPLLAFLALHVHALFLPFPQELRLPQDMGQRILDRDGRLLARTMSKDEVFRAPLSVHELGPHLENAMLAAEDKRFFRHGGIDGWAISRALLQAVGHRHLVSGASTITQQLARSTFRRPRTLVGKWREMALALRIEREIDKKRILEFYLNRVHFGPQIQGASAAADHYFGKSVAKLSLSEAATLAGLVRGPSLYDPRKRPELAERRRNRVLERMVDAGFIPKSSADLARASSVRLLPRPPLLGAKHWVRNVAHRAHGSELRSTLWGPLQREVEQLVAARAHTLKTRDASAAAVVVLDNRSGEILAWVGSPDFDDERDGQNDGVTALRQPGSTLKPFLYAMGIEELGLTTASFLPDEPTQFRTVDSFYAPRNFDRVFRGRVRLERALSNSLNVPAVHVLSRLGIGHALSRLRQVGLRSLREEAEHYGPALALGDGEVTLVELAQAYVTLARGGRTLTPRLLTDEPTAEPKRVLDPVACALVSEILSDDSARREAFGTHSALDLPFPVAVKTGTSKGYRDSWTVGYTRALTVGVWVGNFDGSPTARVTGARGAAPLFHRVMQVAHDKWALLSADLHPATSGHERPSLEDRPLHDVPLVRLPVCEPSEGPSASCPAGQRQALFWFGPKTVDPMAQKESAPTVSHGDSEEPLHIAFPSDGMVFNHDPAIPATRQRLVFRVSPPRPDLNLFLNGKPLRVERGRVEWEVRPGRFELMAQAGDRTESSIVEFLVRP